MNIYKIQSFYGTNHVIGKDKLDAIERLLRVYTNAGYRKYSLPIQEKDVLFSDWAFQESTKHCSSYGVCVTLTPIYKDPKLPVPKLKHICQCLREFTTTTKKSLFCPPCRFKRDKERKRLTSELRQKVKKYEKENKQNN